MVSEVWGFKLLVGALGKSLGFDGDFVVAPFADFTRMSVA